MGQNDIKANLESYVLAFSPDAREIFDHFKFSEFVGLLEDANLLFKVVKKFATTDLSPKAISNYEMGLVFEELIRRFAESSNETAGEHFTTRDIVRLTTSLVFMEDDEALTQDGIIRTIYDPTAGTGGFLSSGMEYVLELNPNAVMRAFGQELNPESYAICKPGRRRDHGAHVAVTAQRQRPRPHHLCRSAGRGTDLRRRSDHPGNFRAVGAGGIKDRLPGRAASDPAGHGGYSGGAVCHSAVWHGQNRHRV